MVSNQKGMGTIEVVIIIAVLIALALLFRKPIFQLTIFIIETILG